MLTVDDRDQLRRSVTVGSYFLCGERFLASGPSGSGSVAAVVAYTLLCLWRAMKIRVCFLTNGSIYNFFPIKQ